MPSKARWAVLVLASVAVAGGVMGVLWWQARRAEDERLRAVYAEPGPTTRYVSTRGTALPRPAEVTIKYELRGHTDGVRRLAVSPDGRTLASASADGTVRLWDIATGAAGRVLSPRAGVVESLAFSPDGKRIASGLIDQLIVWDAASGDMIATMKTDNPVDDVIFGPGPGQVAAACHNVRVWDIEDERLLYTLPSVDRILVLALSQDGTRLAVGGLEGTVVVYDALTREATGSAALPATTKTGGGRQVEGIQFRKDDLLLSTKGGLYRWGGGRTAPERFMTEPCGTQAYVTREGSTIVGSGNVLFVWPSAEETAAALARTKDWRLYPCRVTTHGKDVNALAMAPDGALLAFGGGGNWSQNHWRPGGPASVYVVSVSEMLAKERATRAARVQPQDEKAPAAGPDRSESEFW